MNSSLVPSSEQLDPDLFLEDLVHTMGPKIQRKIAGALVRAIHATPRVIFEPFQTTGDEVDIVVDIEEATEGGQPLEVEVEEVDEEINFEEGDLPDDLDADYGEGEEEDFDETWAETILPTKTVN